VTPLLAARLALTGGRSRTRQVFTTAGVAIGVTMLLLALAVQAAILGRAERTGWKDAAYAVNLPEMPDPPAVAADGAIFLAVTDYHDGARMTRTYVAALGARPPVPPGLDRLPAPGEIALSPALRRLLRDAPDGSAERFPGRDVLTVGDDALAHPDELVAVIGRTPDQLQNVRSTAVVHGFGTMPSGYAYFLALRVLLLTTAALLMVPVVIMIVTVTRIAAAERELRLAALRLAGATRTQIAAVAAVETAVTAGAGALLGWLAYLVGRPILAATVAVGEGRLFPADLDPPGWQVAAVLLGVPLGTVLITLGALRRVPVGPLGLGRLATRPAPTAWPALLVAAGLAGQLAGVGAFAPFLTIAGFVLLGPWLCLMAGRGLARLSRGVPALLAARRAAADPHATFRAVSGVVLAAWAATYLGATVAQFTAGPPAGTDLRPGVMRVNTGGVASSQVAPLVARTGTVVVGLTAGGLAAPCAELARVLWITCPYLPDTGHVERPADGLTVYDLLIPTDGSLATEIDIRNLAADLVPNAIVNSGRDPVDSWGLAFLGGLRPLINLACAFVLVAGACGLAAGTAGGLIERRRPLALLRASGVRVSELRRAVLLETAVPMLLTSLLGVALGLATSWTTTRDTGGWQWPGPAILLVVGVGLLVAVLFAALALPLVGPATRHDAVRFE
jgi:hypothetical protein